MVEHTKTKICKEKNEIEKFTSINTVKLKYFYLTTCNSWQLLQKRITIVDKRFEKIPAQEVTCRRQLPSKSFERIATSFANCEKPLYAIIMSRKSFKVNLHSKVCLNVKELLSKPIRNDQMIHKSFANMAKPWVLHKVNLPILKI